MLRAKKILGYVADHLQPPFMKESYAPTITKLPGKSDDGAAASSSSSTKSGSSNIGTAAADTAVAPVKPEEWLELLCHNQVIPKPSPPGYPYFIPFHLSS